MVQWRTVKCSLTTVGVGWPSPTLHLSYHLTNLFMLILSLPPREVCSDCPFITLMVKLYTTLCHHLVVSPTCPLAQSHLLTYPFLHQYPHPKYLATTAAVRATLAPTAQKPPLKRLPIRVSERACVSKCQCVDFCIIFLMHRLNQICIMVVLLVKYMLMLVSQILIFMS